MKKGNTFIYDEFKFTGLEQYVFTDSIDPVNTDSSKAAQGIRYVRVNEVMLAHRLIYNLSRLTTFFNKKTGLPHELSDANKSTRVAISGIFVRRSSKSGSFGSVVTYVVKWIRYDKTTQKRRWSDPGEAPKPTPKLGKHRNKVMLCVWWNSKGLMYFELLDSGPTVTAKLYQE